MGVKIKKVINTIIIRMIASFKRFPETIGIAAVMVILGIISNHWDVHEEFLGRILLTLALGIPISASIKLLSQRQLLSKTLHFSLDGLLALTLILYYFFLPEDLDSRFAIRYVTLSILLYLIFTLVPYFYKRKNYSLYCLKLLIAFFTTYLYTIVLYLGVLAIFITVNSLFDLNIDTRIYFDLLLIAIGIFGVTFFLGNIPKVDDDLSIAKYPKVLKVLFVSIIMPLLSIYTVVLYAYFIKIIVTFQWPKGLVGHLVLWYGLISIITLFAIETLDADNAFITQYKKLFPYAFLLPLVMMFITLGIRINAYGITLLRYYVLMSGIWFLLIMGYYIFKVKYRTVLIMCTLLILMILSAYGPVNGFSISFTSQNNRLEALLVEYNMLEDNKVVKRTDLEKSEQNAINEIIQYFVSYDALDEIIILPDGFSLKDMEAVFGFEYNRYYGEDPDTEYISYYYSPRNRVKDIANMDYVADFSLDDHRDQEIENEDIRVTLSIEKDSIEVIHHNDSLIAFSIQSMVNELRHDFGNQGKHNQKELVYDINNEQVMIQISLTTINGEIKTSTNEIIINTLSGKMWIAID